MSMRKRRKLAAIRTSRLYNVYITSWFGVACAPHWVAFERGWYIWQQFRRSQKTELE